MKTVADLTAAIVDLMTKRYMEFLKRDIYLAGTGYAGVILPNLALKLTQS